jgi:hypothetical protein
VLIGSDVQQNPILALELYCARVRIATMCAMLKKVLAVFTYRFWSKQLPRHSRAPKSNDTLQAPTAAGVETVQRSWLACEHFVMVGAIARSLLQLLALKYPETLWSRFDAFLRARSQGSYPRRPRLAMSRPAWCSKVCSRSSPVRQCRKFIICVTPHMTTMRRGPRPQSITPCRVTLSRHRLFQRLVPPLTDNVPLRV